MAHRYPPYYWGIEEPHTVQGHAAYPHERDQEAHVKARLYIPDPGNKTGWGSYFVYQPDQPQTRKPLGFG